LDFNRQRARLERNAHRVYDRILIGPKRNVQRPATAVPTGKTVGTHWRNGFFRSQAWREVRAEPKLLWIEPTLVNAERLDEE
jgi:hypothetical protein